MYRRESPSGPREIKAQLTSAATEDSIVVVEDKACTLTRVDLLIKAALHIDNLEVRLARQFGRELKYRRLRLGISQEDLMIVSSISQAEISRIENGKIPPVAPETEKALIAALELMESR